MKSKSANFLFEDQLQWETPGPGMIRQIMGYDGQLMIVKILFQEVGAEGALHSHFHSQSTYIASGKFEVQIDGEKKILSAGDGFYTEPDVPHGLICIEPGVVIDTFSPMRLDFLK